MTYSGLVQPHKQIIPILPVIEMTPGTDPEIETKGGDPINWLTALKLWVSSAFANSFAPTTRFGFADIYAVNPETGVRTFIYTGNVDDVGNALGDNVNAGEGVWVFKSNVGKPIKVYAMEGIWTPDSRNVGSVPADARQDIIDYMLSDDSIFYGQTNGRPLAFQTFTSKINDVLRRRQAFSDV